MFRVTYAGEGVVSNKLGAFQGGTTAYTDDERLAHELASSDSWSVTDKDGTKLGTPAVKEAAQVVSDSPREQHGKRQRHKDQSPENDAG